MVDQYPGATWVDLGRPLSTRALQHDIICFHTMVGTLNGSLAGSSNAGSSYWHFGLDAHGRLVQCQDLQFRSAANVQGNWHVIPIETSDRNEGVWPIAWEPRPWTQAQLDKLIPWCAWLCARYDIPASLIPDTLPSRRGIAYHRQGIDPWRVEGGEEWSLTTGKTCPTDPRIEQLTSLIIPAVQELLAPAPIPEEDSDMLIVNPPGGSAFLLHNGKIVGLKSSADRTALLAAGVGEWVVTDAQWTTLNNAYGPVIHT